jgi:hypothetical protein
VVAIRACTLFTLGALVKIGSAVLFVNSPDVCVEQAADRDPLAGTRPAVMGMALARLETVHRSYALSASDDAPPVFVRSGSKVPRGTHDARL